MSGPVPKPASQRRRRNRTATAAVLVAASSLVAPSELPIADAHPATVEFWAALWASPIVPELSTVDVSGLAMLAQLVEDFYRADSPTARVSLSREIRLLGAEYGLSPISRRRLQWQVTQIVGAEDRRAERASRNRDRPDPRLAEAV